jgi:NADPH-dependent glutamate synthase beta subunit-like oxidoreductase
MPQFDPSKTYEIPFDRIILAIGQTIDPKYKTYLQKLFPTAFTNGYIEIDPNSFLVKGSKNIFAGGDMIRGAGSVVQGVADGRSIAMAIQANLLKKQN